MGWLTDKVKNAQLRDIVLGGTFIIYVLGFLISSIFLGSLGIVNFDILRSRYILTGFAFGVYIFFIGVLLFDLYNRMNKAGNRIRDIISAYLGVLVSAYLVVTVGSWILGGLFEFNSVPVGLPGLTEIATSADWFQEQAEIDFMYSIKIVGIGYLLMFGIFGLIMISAILWGLLKDVWHRNPRKINLKDDIKTSKGVLKKLVSPPVLGSFGAFFLFLFVGRFVDYYTGSQIRYVIERGLDWQRILYSILFVYIVISVYLLAMRMLGLIDFVTSEKTKSEIREANKPRWKDITEKFEAIVAPVFVLTLMTVIAITYFALRIYPLIPQQLGGGKIIQIEIEMNDNEFMKDVLNDSGSLYLLDRGNKSVIIIYLGGGNELEVFEVAASEIKIIKFEQNVELDSTND